MTMKSNIFFLIYVDDNYCINTNKLRRLIETKMSCVVFYRRGSAGELRESQPLAPMTRSRSTLILIILMSVLAYL